MQLVSIGQLALMLGVAVVTLRRWHASGDLVPVCRTPGGHRRYDVGRVREQLKCAAAGAPRSTVAYARVSSHDQKEHLKTQALRLQQHCQAQGWEAQVLPDPGSGMNCRKPGLQRLLRGILAGEIGRLVLVTKDRLLRFGSELLFSVCRFCAVEVIVLD